MPQRNDIHAVLHAIERGQRFAVTAHARPDGDAIGSMLACGMILQQMGKEFDLVSFDRVPRIYTELPCAEVIRQTPTLEGQYDGVILLECDSIERCRIAGLEDRFLINIDHHLSGKNFADVNWIETGACAVAEMIYDLAAISGVQITAEMATCLYTAVLTDTGAFCYAATDAHTFELASDLVRQGADPALIARRTYFTNPASKMMLLGAALSNLHREGRIAWMWITYDDMLRTGAQEEDCEGLVNYAIGIAGIEVAVFMRELEDGRVRLSLRSKGSLNVASVAESLGGGGHQHASGCTLDGPIPVTTGRILDHLRVVCGTPFDTRAAIS